MKEKILVCYSLPIRFHTNVEWMQRVGVSGIVLWPRVMFALPMKRIPAWLFRHEMQHVYQIQRLGPWRFYFKFFWYSLFRGYKNNPFEIEARNHQFDLLTHQERELLWKLRGELPPQQSGSLPKLKPVTQAHSLMN